MANYDLMDLITMRESILSKQETAKQKEITDKLDALILIELNKSNTPTATERV